MSDAADESVEMAGENFESSCCSWPKTSPSCDGEKPIGGGVVAIGVEGKGGFVEVGVGDGGIGDNFGGGVNDRKRRLLSCAGGETWSWVTSVVFLGGLGGIGGAGAGGGGGGGGGRGWGGPTSLEMSVSWAELCPAGGLAGSAIFVTASTESRAGCTGVFGWVVAFKPTIVRGDGGFCVPATI